MTKKSDRSNPYRRRSRPKKGGDASRTNDADLASAVTLATTSLVNTPLSALSQLPLDTTHARNTQLNTQILNEYYYNYSQQNDSPNPVQHVYYDNESISALIEQEEIMREEIERKKWSAWANHAAEVERLRRMSILKKISDEEEIERKVRGKIAIDLIEKERNDRISAQFLLSLTSTHWFNEITSTYNEDYDLVCPYYKLGCRTSCRRSTVTSHLENCQYALESKPCVNENSDDGTMKPFESQEYDIVCPNSVLGCSCILRRKDLESHLQICLFRGTSVEDDLRQRDLVKQTVILECEEERSRRVQSTERHKNDVNNDGSLVILVDPPRISVHGLLRNQIHKVLSTLHSEILNSWHSRKQEHSVKQVEYEQLLQSLKSHINLLWPFTKTEIFGSFANGIHDSKSDIDLVVCFADSYLSNISIQGSIPYLHILADYLITQAAGIITIKQVLLFARVPLIKAEAKVNGSIISIDISIDGPSHSGLSTTEFSATLINHIPPLGPIILLLKEYFKKRDLCDPFTGGIPSYGVLLMTLSCICRYSNAQANHLDTEGIRKSVYTPPPLSPPKHTKHKHNKLVKPEERYYSFNSIALKRLYGINIAKSMISQIDISSLVDGKNVPYCGVLLEQVLREFGEQMQLGTHGYSCRDGGFRFVVSDNSFPHPHANDPLVIEDPVNVMNNVTRNTYKAPAVQKACQDALDKFRNFAVKSYESDISLISDMFK